MSRSPKPSERSKNLNKAQVVFPADLERNKIYFMINVREYKPVTNLYNSIKEGNDSTVGEVLTNKSYYFLPIPQQGLNEVFNLNYRTLDMQATGGIAESIQNFIRDRNIDNAVLGAGAAAEFIGKKLLESGSSALLGLFGTRPDQAEALVELATGVADNPNLALLFKGVQLRNHTFSWKFLPRNKEESASIKALTRSLVASALPSGTAVTGKTNLLLGYPDVVFFKILGPNKDLITINKNGSFINNVKLAYSDGEVAFFKDTFEPAEVTLSISLQERSIITREDYEGKAVDLLQDKFTG